MILIYTGNGKGKSSASCGQALRALGRGMRVAFAQFMKQDGKGGEQVMLAKLLQENFLAGGKGFFMKQEQFPAHRAAAREVLAWVAAKIPGLDLLVLDEALYALNSGLITKDELEKITAFFAGDGKPVLVLSGRGLPDWLREEAHLVTEMQEIKHPYAQGIPAQTGVDF